MTENEYREAQEALDECRNKALDMLEEGHFSYVDKNHEEIEKIQDYIRRNS